MYEVGRDIEEEINENLEEKRKVGARGRGGVRVILEIKVFTVT